MTPAPSCSGRPCLHARSCSGHHLSGECQLHVLRPLLRPGHCHRCQRRCGCLHRRSAQSGLHDSASRKLKRNHVLQTGFCHYVSSISDLRVSNGCVVRRKSRFCPTELEHQLSPIPKSHGATALLQPLDTVPCQNLLVCISCTHIILNIEFLSSTFLPISPKKIRRPSLY